MTVKDQFVNIKSEFRPILVYDAIFEGHKIPLGEQRVSYYVSIYSFNNIGLANANNVKAEIYFEGLKEPSQTYKTVELFTTVVSTNVLISEHDGKILFSGKIADNYEIFGFVADEYDFEEIRDIERFRSKRDAIGLKKDAFGQFEMMAANKSIFVPGENGRFLVRSFSRPVQAYRINFYSDEVKGIELSKVAERKDPKMYLLIDIIKGICILVVTVAGLLFLWRGDKGVKT